MAKLSPNYRAAKSFLKYVKEHEAIKTYGDRDHLRDIIYRTLYFGEFERLQKEFPSLLRD